jgi:hypothetical protein
MRRMPAATPLSLMILNTPISAVLATWVPPQSSIDTPGTSTTRTTSAYFSPNIATAPAALACSIAISCHHKGVGLADPAVDQGLNLLQLLGRPRRGGSGSRSADGRSPPASRPGRSPGSTTCLRAACSRWVAVWLAWARRRQAASTRAVSRSPTATAAALDLAAVHEHRAVAAHRLDAHDHAITGEHAAVAHLTAALAVEGGGIEHQLHTVASDGLGGRLTVHHQGQHAAGVLQGPVALEGGGLGGGRHLINGLLQGEVDAHRRGLGPLALGLHRRLEAR